MTQNASAGSSKAQQVLGEDVNRTKGGTARRYNLLAAKLIAELVKNSFGPYGMEKLLVDILGEVTVTKDGSALLRKIDVEHPAAKVMIEASNTVDNEVGDGTTAVVVIAGALVEKAEELLDMGISPSSIIDGYSLGLDLSLKALKELSVKFSNSDRQVMSWLAETCLNSKVLGLAAKKTEELIVNAVFAVSDFGGRSVDVDDIKIEEKQGNVTSTELISGIVIDKTIDSSSMPKSIEHAKIILIDDELEGKATRTDAQIQINSPQQLLQFKDAEVEQIRSKVKHIVESGANVVFSRKGINTLAQQLLSQADIISVRRVKENDLLWLSKATGATITEQLDHSHSEKTHSHEHLHNHRHFANSHSHASSHGDHYHHGDIDIKLGYAARVSERLVGDDKMVFVEGCKKPRAVTLLLRAGSKRTLDECHRSAIDAISVLRDFVADSRVVVGGGSTEAAIAKMLKAKAPSINSREQLVVAKFAEALEVIPLTLARNAGMDPVNTLAALRHGTDIRTGIDITNRRVDKVLDSVIEPSIVKEQVLKTAVEVANLLLRVDDVVMAKPVMNTHTHDDGTQHSHRGGDKDHRHDYFDNLGKKQRPGHHYY